MKFNTKKDSSHKRSLRNIIGESTKISLDLALRIIYHVFFLSEAKNIMILVISLLSLINIIHLLSR